jgi:hypothetical protein
MFAWTCDLGGESYRISDLPRQSYLYYPAVGWIDTIVTPRELAIATTTLVEL